LRKETSGQLSERGDVQLACGREEVERRAQQEEEEEEIASNV